MTGSAGGQNRSAEEGKEEEEEKKKKKKKKKHPSDASAGARFRANAVKAVKFVLAQWLVIGFGLSCVFAYLFP
ncbi:hypothetical protein CTA2_9325, partial [Colletotrichum tanaceti]